MKWQGYNEKAAERMNGFVVRIINSRSILVLIALAAMVVVAAATNKWGG